VCFGCSDIWSEDIEDFVCAVVAVIFGVCKLVGLF
jgi:hypothetical protein